jgi:hypothetical protein
LHSISQRRHAVGLVVDALRVELVEIAEDGLLHQLRVQRRHAIDRVATHERQLPHADAAAAALVDQRHIGDLLIIEAGLGPRLGQHLGIDGVDDLHLPRQHALQQRHWPCLERLR